MKKLSLILAILFLLQSFGYGQNTDSTNVAQDSVNVFNKDYSNQETEEISNNKKGKTLGTGIPVFVGFTWVGSIIALISTTPKNKPKKKTLQFKRGEGFSWK